MSRVNSTMGMPFHTQYEPRRSLRFHCVRVGGREDHEAGLAELLQEDFLADLLPEVVMRELGHVQAVVVAPAA